MSFLDLLKHRRSIRQYKEEAVSKEALEAIVEAGLLSPSGRNIRPWELIVVQKKETLEKMSECRVGSAKMLAGASVAIVVIADPEKTDVWTEDCSIVMSNMHNMAHDLGLGSCWIHRAKEEFESEEGKGILKTLGIAGDYEGIGHCVLGYAATASAEPKERKASYIYYAE